MFDNLAAYTILFLGRALKWYNQLALIKKN